MIVTFHVSSSGPPTYRDTFRCRPEHTPAVRGLVRTALAVWRLDGLVGDAELVVTELASNAMRHTGSGEMGITVALVAEKLVRITVRDESDAFPVFHPPSCRWSRRRVRIRPHAGRPGDVPMGGEPHPPGQRGVGRTRGGGTVGGPLRGGQRRDGRGPAPQVSATSPNPGNGD